MHSDFPRILSLLRKEKNISQKQAAADLGVSQALLSHYEKGIRECGLEFIVRAADYYNVSCDYLLGRSPEPSGHVSSLNEKAPVSQSGEKTDSGELSSKKSLILNSADAVLTLAERTGSPGVFRAVSHYILLAVYRMFRVVYSANERNDSRFFTVPENASAGLTDAAMSVNCAIASESANEKPVSSEDTVITTQLITEKYPDTAPALLASVKECEREIMGLAAPLLSDIKGSDSKNKK